MKEKGYIFFAVIGIIAFIAVGVKYGEKQKSYVDSQVVVQELVEGNISDNTLDNKSDGLESANGFVPQEAMNSDEKISEYLSSHVLTKITELSDKKIDSLIHIDDFYSGKSLIVAKKELNSNYNDSYVFIIDKATGSVHQELLFHCNLNLNKTISFIPGKPGFFEGNCFMSRGSESVSLFMVTSKSIRNLGNVSEETDFGSSIYISKSKYEDLDSDGVLEVIEHGKNYERNSDASEPVLTDNNIMIYQWNSSSEKFLRLQKENSLYQKVLQ